MSIKSSPSLKLDHVRSKTRSDLRKMHYVCVLFGAHNSETFYSTKFKFSMIFSQTNTFDFMVELTLGLALWWSQGSDRSY